MTEKKGLVYRMNWFNKLERKYAKYAIKNLMTYIIGLYTLGIVVNILIPDIYTNYLSLNAAAILHGQLWRIVTFIIQPPSTTNLIFIVFVLYFYYMIGTVLEQIWGSFRFNMYFFTGVLLHVIAAIVIYLFSGYNFSMNTYYLNLALFMAFAIEQPDMEILLFFILPVKMKWLAWLDAILFAVTIIGGYCVPWMPLTLYIRFMQMGIVLHPAIATAALISMLNFVIFAVLYHRIPLKNSTQRNFNKAYKTAKKVEKKRNQNRQQGRFFSDDSERGSQQTVGKMAGKGIVGAKHRCAVCKRTEYDDSNLVFRYCSKCKGNYEYCQEHLYTHIHVSEK
jgi:hypothetical protein